VLQSAIIPTSSTRSTIKSIFSIFETNRNDTQTNKLKDTQKNKNYDKDRIGINNSAATHGIII
jgi:diketogulonate reductase-like aldo/keto reductase